MSILQQDALNSRVGIQMLALTAAVGVLEAEVDRDHNEMGV